MWALTILLIGSNAWAEAPDWTKEQSRQVIGSDIVHWGSGYARSPEAALFRARHMAIKAILEECGGFASKDIIPRKQHVEPRGVSFHTAYAQVSINFDSCEFGKKPGDKKEFENAEIKKGQAIYNRLVHNIPIPDEQEKTAAELERQVQEMMRAKEDSNQQAFEELKNKFEALKASVLLKAQEAAEEKALVRDPANGPENCVQKLYSLWGVLKDDQYQGNWTHPTYQEAGKQFRMLYKRCPDFVKQTTFHTRPGSYKKRKTCEDKAQALFGKLRQASEPYAYNFDHPAVVKIAKQWRSQTASCEGMK